MDERLMTVRDLATYLKLNERTVLKLAAEGPLPAVKVGNQWRFRKAMVDAWLDDQMLGIGHRYVSVHRPAESPPMFLDLASCFGPNHVVPHLAGTTKVQIIEELALHAHHLELVRDKTWFVGGLIERENMMPTAMGNGVAFLHTLGRNPQQVVRPFMVLGRSPDGVNFDALDGRPTYLFFVLGLKYTELFLPWLSKLAQMLARPGAVASIRAAPNAEAVVTLLTTAERNAEPATR